MLKMGKHGEAERVASIHTDFLTFYEDPYSYGVIHWLIVSENVMSTLVSISTIT
jgi:hypothetical protein